MVRSHSPLRDQLLGQLPVEFVCGQKLLLRASLLRIVRMLLTLPS